jgi:hypothetical protein
MPLCLVAVMGAALFGSLGATHGRFQEIYRLERGLIALDNAAILLGRSAREVWKGLVRFNAWAEKAELAHHVAHVCARAPIAGSPCRAADQAWEAALASAHRLAGARAHLGWTQGRRDALIAARKLGVEVTADRAPTPPIRSKRCSVCGLLTRWDIVGPAPESVWARLHQREFRNRVESIGRSLKGGETWAYRVREAHGR